MNNSYDFLKAQLLPVVSKAQLFTQCATPAAAHAGLNEDICAFPTVPHTWYVPASPSSGACPASQTPSWLMCIQGPCPASLLQYTVAEAREWHIIAKSSSTVCFRLEGFYYPSRCKTASWPESSSVSGLERC